MRGSHRRPAGLFVAALLGLVLATGGPAQVAGATSCVGYPDDVAEDIVQGRLPDMANPGQSVAFTKQFDLAVIGTVRSVRGDDSGKQPVEALVDVHQAFFQPTGTSITLEMSDTGVMLGYPFEAGRTYLIPVETTGPTGLHNYVMLCNPVREVTEAQVGGLVAKARAAGVPVAEPGRSDVTEPVPGNQPAGLAGPSRDTAAGSNSTAWALGAGGVVLAGAVVAGLVWNRRRLSGR